jgi:archaellum component FlaG (FlaF/FlaG flagellin family)
VKKLAGFVLMVVFFFSCQNADQWYPSADVTISSHDEYDTPVDGNGLMITFIINNTGKTSIINSTLTVKVTTDKHEYMQTVAANNRIIPSGKVAVTMTIAYLEAGEHVITDGIVLYDRFFE